MKMRVQTGFLVLGLAVYSVSASAAPTVADYQRSLNLRNDWSGLTENIAEPAQWIEGTHRFIYRKTVPGGFQFVMMDADTKAKSPAFDQDRLAASLSKALGETYSGLHLPFTEPMTSVSFTDGDKGLVTWLDEDEAWSCTLTDYVCARVPESAGQPRGFGVVRDLTIPADNSPKPSPDGKWIAFVQGFNVVVKPAAGGAMTVLSTDGSEGEFYDPQSIVWSPDSQKLAAYRVRPGFARHVTRVISSPEGEIEPKLATQLYPKPGDAVDIDRPVLFDVVAKKQINVPFDLFPNPYTMSNINWRADSSAITFEYDQRGHQAYRLIEASAKTGVARIVAEDHADTFVNIERRYSHDVGGLGKELIWMSERDGWNHLYLYDQTTGKVKTQITRGDWIVRKVLKVDDQKRQIWFAASGIYPGKDPYFQHVFRVDFDGRHLTPITTTDAWHDVSFSSDMAYYVDTYSRIDLPNIAELHSNDGALVTEVEHGDITKLLAAGFKAPEVFTAKGRDGKTDIWGIIVRPRNFDPNKKYPVIENIYAGPHDNFVPKTFWPFGLHSGGDKVVGMQAQADLGFIVVQIDGMGTMNRSKAFHDVAWKNVGDSGFPDRILWHKAVAAKYPWYDISRIGIYGGSAGGQSSLGALEFHPDFYKAAVAYAGCYDNRMDKISWNEEWMGWPVDDAYSKSSGVDNAWRLQGHILMIVGEQDTNVDPSSTLQVANALIKARKDFDLIVAPNQGHGALRNVGDFSYGLRRQYDYFVRYLRDEPTPDWNALPETAPKAP
ncbi:S9 family peptidase [Asticcacaulis taihuensis]|uniref:Dipeptidyl aminopeptidase/acylaminoacyl peptidase n=1 Tax=Asticcacaulis taihuensis TaxID=260084 RepID=A0A1G4QGL3_9CAUL|nr:S9 family peptidase [Asticcacaulis taihuensis]SCW43744.1 Dipeptidyl aminopeptidase/acylaminoacyl peptidase [Asticcacaulis taihuensis]